MICSTKQCCIKDTKVVTSLINIFRHLIITKQPEHFPKSSAFAPSMNNVTLNEPAMRWKCFKWLTFTSYGMTAQRPICLTVSGSVSCISCIALLTLESNHTSIQVVDKIGAYCIGINLTVTLAFDFWNPGDTKEEWMHSIFWCFISAELFYLA